MGSVPTSLLRLEDQDAASTNWGERVDGVFARLEEAIASTTTIAVTGGTRILSVQDFVADESRSPFIDVTGVLASNQTIIVADVSKQYLITNKTTGLFSLTIKTAGGIGVAIPQNYLAPLRVSQGLGVTIAGALINPTSGLIYGAAPSDFTGVGYAGTPRSMLSKSRDVVNIRDYGGAPDGVTPTRAAVVAAVANGAKTIIFDEGSSSYYWESPYQFPSGLTFEAGSGMPVFTFNPAAATSRFFTMPARRRCVMRGIRFDGSAIPIRGDAFIVVNGGSTHCSFEDCEFQSCPATGTGCVVFSNPTTKYNSMRWCKFFDTYAEGIGFSGSQHNTIFMVSLFNTGGFAVRIGELAHFNRVIGLTSISSLREGIGIYRDCCDNHLEACHIEGAGDNGISITGRRTTVVGCHCINNLAAGIGIWGEDNNVTLNTCLNNGQGNRYPFWAVGESVMVGDYYFNSSTAVLYQCTIAGLTTLGNVPVHGGGTTFVTADGVGWLHINSRVRWAGIWVAVGYGGIGQNNTISNNNCDDDQDPTGKWRSQWFGVLIEGSGGYTAWGVGQTVLGGDPQYSYRVNGLNLYTTANGGFTAAGASPTHTSGFATGSDGIIWEYKKSFNGSAQPRGNTVTCNPAVHTKGGRPVADAAAWIANTLISHGEQHLNVTNGLQLYNLQTYADDAAAAAAGIALWDVYKTPAGVMQIKL